MEQDFDKEMMYKAFCSRDPRFDGRFFVGVSSTGIYCRPVCSARMPKIENCSFFDSAAAAEAAGYRPCLICRPELAPEDYDPDVSSVLARRAAKYISKTAVMACAFRMQQQHLDVQIAI